MIKHNFDQTPKLLETLDQLIRSSEIRSSDPLSVYQVPNHRVYIVQHYLFSINYYSILLNGGRYSQFCNVLLIYFSGLCVSLFFVRRLLPGPGPPNPTGQNHGRFYCRIS